MERHSREGNGIERSAIREGLDHECRRLLLRALREDGRIAFENAVADLADHDGCRAEVVATGGGEDEVALDLHHFHLPKLDALGVVEYDHDAGTIEETDATEDVYEVLDDVYAGGDP